MEENKVPEGMEPIAQVNEDLVDGQPLEDVPSLRVDTLKWKIRLAAIKKSATELAVEQNQRAGRLDTMYEQINDSIWKIIKEDDLLGETSWILLNERSLKTTKSLEMMPELKEILHNEDNEYEMFLPDEERVSLYVDGNFVYLHFRSQEEALKFANKMNLVLSPLGMEKIKEDCIKKMQFCKSIIEMSEDAFVQEFLAHEKEELEALAQKKVEEAAKRKEEFAAQRQQILDQVEKEKEKAPEFAEGMNKLKDILGELGELVLSDDGEISEERKAFREELKKQIELAEIAEAKKSEPVAKPEPVVEVENENEKESS